VLAAGVTSAVDAAVGSALSAAAAVDTGATSALGAGAGAALGGATSAVDSSIALSLVVGARSAVAGGSGAGASGGSTVGGGAGAGSTVGSVDGASGTPEADARPTGIVLIAKVDADSSVRIAARIGLEQARRFPPGLNSLDRHDPTEPDVRNRSRPPGVFDLRAASSQQSEPGSAQLLFEKQPGIWSISVGKSAFQHS
jgi:hypothetical protein